MKTMFCVLAFRYGGKENTFPIGVFTNELAAKQAAKDHRAYRGGKYDHRIYEFTPDKWDDDIGHAGNNAPCIEANVRNHRCLPDGAAGAEGGKQ